PIYMRRLDGSAAVRIGEGNAGGFSADGRWVLTSTGNQISIVPTGAGEPKRLPKSNLNIQGTSWFPDGKRILAVANEPGHGSRLYVQDVAGGGLRPITPELVTARFHPISPDGKSIVATGADRRLAIYSIEPGEPRPIPGVEAEDTPLRWTSDG